MRRDRLASREGEAAMTVAPLGCQYLEKLEVALVNNEMMVLFLGADRTAKLTVL